jgi:uncharacterized protein with HEPN domain
MNAADRIRLQHMLDAATEALAFVAGMTKPDLLTDRRLPLAPIKELEISAELRAGPSELTGPSQ